MLLQFSVSNFGCFRTRQTLNFAASAQDKSLPDNVIQQKLPGLPGSQWVKGVAVYGANASGKSTVLDALRALASMVKESAKMTDPKEPIPQIVPFALCPGQPTAPTAFSVVFVTDGVRYEYRVAATRERIVHESLRAFPKAKEQLWFSRDFDAQTQRYTFTPERPTGFVRDSQLEGYTLSNMLFLSKAIASNRSDLEPVYRWFTERLQVIDLSGQGDLHFDFSLRQVAEQTALKDRIATLLRHADLGVSGVSAVDVLVGGAVPDDFLRALSKKVQEQLRKGKFPMPELTHRGQAGAEVALPWKYESAGTQRFFALVGPWLDILHKGYTVCIDELETSLHPLLVRELLRLLFSSEENAAGAQLLFTTHNPLLLDATLLRRDQVWFTDKDDHGEAHLYPLTDYQPRKEESLVRGYLSGRYGAVPFLPDGLLVAPEASPAPPKPARKGRGKAHE
jgi:hypothetical protein